MMDEHLTEGILVQTGNLLALVCASEEAHE